MSTRNFSSYIMLSCLLIGSLGVQAHADPALDGGNETVDKVHLYTDEQLAQVTNFLGKEASAGPQNIIQRVAQDWLSELATRRPEQLARLSSEVSLQPYKSALLQRLAVALSAPQYSSLRDELARKRVGAVLQQDGQAKHLDSNVLIEKIRTSSSYYHQRLVEGKVDDDELLTMLKRAGESAPTSEKKEVLPKVLSVSDVVSEFVRHNQVGAAADHLYGYRVEATLKTATGEIQNLLLYRMRPDRFRLVIQSNGSTQLILGSNGEDYWQQLPQRAVQKLTAKEMGGRVYLSEFLNPLFDPDGSRFSHEDDGVVGQRKVYRVGVKRGDESRYISCIDKEEFKEIGRENQDGSKVVASDFHDIDGVTFAFREEATDAKGQKGTFIINKIIPNPGVLQTLFDPSDLSQPSYFSVESLVAGTALSGGKSP